MAGASLVQSVVRKLLGAPKAKHNPHLGHDTALAVDGVYKRYKVYHDPASGPVKDLISLWRRRDLYNEYLAVRDVSLEIRKGEVVGILGTNGAGKSTLLKMIAGLLSIDRGAIHINGKVTAVLTTGLGVHPEFTGRENILYGGMLMGMTKAEVTRKTDEIIDFCELGEYIDQPLRTYSAGMRARLLFAIAMSIEPDILIVDEALAAGDKYFLDKCTERIQQICASGATVLMVSHNLAQIEVLCNRAVLMHRGRLWYEGETQDTIQKYSELVAEQELLGFGNG